MRLKKLSVKGFKNLKNFEINFESQDGITVLIGNNASGKSNVLEAISAIFKFLYDFEKPSLNLVNFYFDITYSINDCEVNCFRDKQYDIGFKVKERGKKNFKHKDMTGFYEVINNYSTTKVYKYLPSQVIALYSGEELRMWNYYYRQFYLTYNKNIISGNEIATNNQKMLYVNKYYWDIALLVMIISDIDVSDIIDSNIKRFNIGLHSKNIEKFHKTPNLVTQFVHDIAYIKNNKESTHQYCHSKTETIENFKTLVADTHRQLFNLLCVAYLPKDDNDKLITSLKLYFENDTETQDFSEGQKKQILLKLALEVLADENSLLLFDEPDAHIHIDNKKLIPNILKEYDGKRNVVLTTHSPTLAHSFDEDNILMLATDNNKNAKVENANKIKIINDITGGLWSYHQQNLFLSSKDLVLLVEGNTDKVHIETAFKKLKDDYENNKLEFDVFSMRGCQNIKQFILGIKGSQIFDKNKICIAIFDTDEEGKECHDIVMGQTKNDGIFHSIKILDDDNLEIENMYPIGQQQEAYQEALLKYCNNNEHINIKKIETEAKRILSVKCKDFDKAIFDRFKTLFDKIIEIKNQS